MYSKWYQACIEGGGFSEIPSTNHSRQELHSCMRFKAPMAFASRACFIPLLSGRLAGIFVQVTFNSEKLVFVGNNVVIVQYTLLLFPIRSLESTSHCMYCEKSETHYYLSRSKTK